MPSRSRLFLPCLIAVALACGGDATGPGVEPAPVITVTGVADGETYQMPVTIGISVDRGSYEATLDGATFVSGSTVSAPGEHTLQVSARNGVATSSRTISFSIAGELGELLVASWNVEFFGDASNGPPDERLQLQNVSSVIATTGADVWGLQEVVAAPAFDSLKARLPGYDGFLASDPRVASGSAFYSVNEQKLAFLYRTAAATLVSARLILTSQNSTFAGRPPLEVRMRIGDGTAAQDAVFIVLHLKCCTDAGDWEQRASAAAALKSYLDATWPTQKVWIIGDWNDDLDVSIDAGRPTPFANFIADSADYRFPTKALSDARVSTLTFFPDAIDHHLVTNEVYAGYVAGSAAAPRPAIANYSSTTSDHYPVLTRYRPGT